MLRGDDSKEHVSDRRRRSRIEEDVLHPLERGKTRRILDPPDGIVLAFDFNRASNGYRFFPPPFAVVVVGVVLLLLFRRRRVRIVVVPSLVLFSPVVRSRPREF